MLRHLFIVSLILYLSACGSSPKTHFYTLDTNHPSNTPSDHRADGVRIGIWRVKLPELLDRSAIVTRRGQYNIELADFHKWADRLDDNISRLIASELANRLQTDRVVVSPWPTYAKNDYQIKIHIDRFDGELGGEIVLSGAWSLLNGEGNKELARKTFTFKEQAAGATYGDMIASLSQLTVQLAEKIAHIVSTQ